MRRIILSMACLLLFNGSLLAQSRQLSPSVNIKGVFKYDYENVKKGTPFSLQQVVKVTKAKEQGVSRTQAVLVVNGIQMGLPVDMLKMVELIPEDKNTFWPSCQLSDDLVSYYEKKGYQEEMRKEQAQEANEYLLHQYQELLNVMFQQPHSEEDAQWIAAEHTWAEKLLDRTYIL